MLALASIEVDLAPIAEGQAVTVKWRGNPLIIRHRSKADIDAAKAVKIEDLLDSASRNANAKGNVDATDENRVVGGKEQFLVMLGVCTIWVACHRATKAIMVWSPETRPLAAGYALAMARNMIRQAACAKAQRLKICQCLPMSISPTLKSASAN